MSSKVQSLTFFSIHTPASLLPRAKNSQHSAQWAFGHIRPLRKVPIILAENANSLEKLGARKVKNSTQENGQPTEQIMKKAGEKAQEAISAAIDALLGGQQSFLLFCTSLFFNNPLSIEHTQQLNI